MAAALLWLAGCLAPGLAGSARRSIAPDPAHAPYPPSPLLSGLDWHWETYRHAAHGSDLWPVTWADDNHLYAAWGDGGGFGGSDADGRVAMGIARIEGGPEHYRGVNVNGGKAPEHPASFLRAGKTAGLVCVDGTLYATINLQDGPWPNVNHALAWSTDHGATWTRADWLFPAGAGSFQPATFLQFGRDYAGVPALLAGYVYLYGARQPGTPAPRSEARRRAAAAPDSTVTTADPPVAIEPDEAPQHLYLVRIPRDQLRRRAAYEFWAGFGAKGRARWTGVWTRAQPVFTDPNGVASGHVVYDPVLKTFLLTTFHVGPGQLGVFHAPHPWGPWRTVAYYSQWAGLGAAGEGLSCEFPQKWMSADGLTLGCVFSVYGPGAKQGIYAHDRFNLVQVSLTPIRPRAR